MDTFEPLVLRLAGTWSERRKAAVDSFDLPCGERSVVNQPSVSNYVLSEPPPHIDGCRARDKNNQRNTKGMREEEGYRQTILSRRARKSVQ